MHGHRGCHGPPGWWAGSGEEWSVWPKHSYEITRDVERHAHCEYVPSPETTNLEVHTPTPCTPKPDTLEDTDRLCSLAREERRVYQLTDAGR